MFCFLFNLLIYAGGEKYHLAKWAYFCYLDLNESPSVYTRIIVGLAIFLYIMPSPFVGYMYWKILSSLNTSSPDAHISQVKYDLHIRVAKQGLSFSILVVVMYLPPATYLFMLVLGLKRPFPSNIFAYWLLSVYPAVNPIFCYLTDVRLKKGIDRFMGRILFCCNPTVLVRMTTKATPKVHDENRGYISSDLVYVYLTIESGGLST